MTVHLRPFKRGQQVPNGQFELTGQTYIRDDSSIQLSFLNFPEVRPVKARSVSQLLQAQLPLLTKFTDSGPQGFKVVRLRGVKALRAALTRHEGRLSAESQNHDFRSDDT